MNILKRLAALCRMNFGIAYSLAEPRISHLQLLELSFLWPYWCTSFGSAEPNPFQSANELRLMVPAALRSQVTG